MTDARFPTQNRIMVIGIDGATFQIIDPLLRKGELPALGRLIQEGTRGVLASTLHPSSPPAWASLMTGMNPGKHGIFDFIARDPASYEFRLVNGSYLGAPTLPFRLSQAGKQVGIINVPMTYPPEQVKGFLISGMDSPRLDRAYSFPPSLSAEIDQVCGGYLLDSSKRGPRGLSTEQMTSLYSQRLIEVVRQRGIVARYLWQKYHPDFFMVVFVAADRIQHAAGEAIEGVADEKSAGASRCITEVYRNIDLEIERLLAQIDESWTVMIVSDHGAAPYRRVFNLTHWLGEKNFLALSKALLPSRLLDLTERTRHKLLYTLRLEARQGRRKTSPLLRRIDWERTKAYAFGAFGSIFVNLRGREPYGVVEPGKAYEELCDEISEHLLAATDPVNGARLVEAVYRGQDVYNGECVGRAPDLLLVPTRDYHVVSSIFDYRPSLTYPAGRYGRRSTLHTGKHTPDGVFIVCGPEIRKGAEIQNPQIVDVAPSILYLLGEPIPHEMDGRVLEEAIHPDLVASYPPLLIESEEAETRGQGQNGYSESEERDVEERLRGLGYLG